MAVNPVVEALIQQGISRERAEKIVRGSHAYGAELDQRASGITDMIRRDPIRWFRLAVKWQGDIRMLRNRLAETSEECSVDDPAFIKGMASMLIELLIDRMFTDVLEVSEDA